MPWAPWINQVAAPVQAGQCLIVASGESLYGDAGSAQIFVHGYSTESTSVSLPPMFSDVVATHPCRLPPSIRLLDTISFVATVPCAEAPSSAAEAGAIVRAQLDACEG